MPHPRQIYKGGFAIVGKAQVRTYGRMKNICLYFPTKLLWIQSLEHLVGKRNKKGLCSYKRKSCLQEVLLSQDRGLADLSLSLQIHFCFLCLCVSHDVLCTSESLHRHSTNHSPEGIISWILCEVVSRQIRLQRLNSLLQYIKFISTGPRWSFSIV